MLKTILSIAGKPGLYKLISQGKNMLIVETVDAAKKRVPAYAHDKVISLADIAMYTDAEEVPLSEVLEAVKKKENGAVASINYKKASADELHAYFVNIKPLLEYIKKRKIKVVWTFHCEYMYTGKCGYTYDCKKYMSGCDNCPAIKEYPKSILFDKTKQMYLIKKKLLEDMDVEIITPSKWLADRVKLSFLKDKKIRVIHNGIDINIFHPMNVDDLKKQLNISPKDKVVIAIAPDIMIERKGGKQVLKLAKSMIDQSVVFVLVGAK